MSSAKDFNFNMVHIGINQGNQEEAKNTANVLTGLFGFTQRETPGSIFAGNGFEIMKSKFLGKCGHIAISCNDVPGAKAYLETKGIEFNEKSAIYDDKGKLSVIYLKNDIGGFAFHLVQEH